MAPTRHHAPRYSRWRHTADELGMNHVTSWADTGGKPIDAPRFAYCECNSRPTIRRYRMVTHFPFHFCLLQIATLAKNGHRRLARSWDRVAEWDLQETRRLGGPIGHAIGYAHFAFPMKSLGHDCDMHFEFQRNDFRGAIGPAKSRTRHPQIRWSRFQHFKRVVSHWHSNY
jgi:hypothetical protein